MGSLSQPRLNIFTVGNMGVMICLGQGGLRSLSASSSSLFFKNFVLFFIHVHFDKILKLLRIRHEVYIEFQRADNIVSGLLAFIGAVYDGPS